MERSFSKEVEALRLGAGETFRGEGILAVTKALLQSGVSYVGGYQGAPVSHLLDVMVEAEDLLAELGVHVETCTNEAAAAAMLGASINYPLRGAVTWKSIVGTNVAADALSNLASPGVIGGALIVLGEDYGEGASVIQDIPARPPNFCTGCPERPVFAAIKLAQRELGPVHISADIGCHSFATFAPFSLGNSILGYGMSLASAAAVAPNMAKRPIAVMGDGGFWHNGLITGVASNVFNKGDGVLVIMQSGYASATGQQYLPSSSGHRSGAPTGISIEKTLRSLGVHWLRTVRSYSVGTMAATLKQAMRSAERGLKVIIADGECMLARQRRLRVEQADKLKRGARVVKTRYGVDDELCTMNFAPATIPASGCPAAHR
jgi:TPP-dependent indolepyruvate ferredoxin oxidoreductase alpha subunit